MSFPKYSHYKDTGVEWLREVPEHWEVKRIKRSLQQLTEKTPGREKRLGLENIESWTGRYLPTDSEFEGDGVGFESGDILFGKLRPYLAKVLVAEFPGAAVGDFHVLRPQSGLEPRFIAYQFLSPAFISIVDGSTFGSKMPRASWEFIGGLASAVPPHAEQQAITRFLDREAAKIDVLIAEQQRLIELLKEKRRTVISHAVTRGLNPDAPMKQSGIEWLGTVPAHWEIVPLGKITSSRCDGPFGSGLKSEHYTERGARVIRLQNIRAGYFAGSDEAFVDVDYFRNELIGHDVQPGDLLIAGLGDDRNTVGRACVAPDGIAPALVKADCFRFRLNIARVSPAFASAQLNAGAQADAGVLATGSTRSRIPLSVMSTRALALPPVAEQNVIVGFIEAKKRSFDALTAEAERAIALLQERRTALISAAVTGKIDVRGLEESAA
jgi:type I restriction enzyme S subunit